MGDHFITHRIEVKDGDVAAATNAAIDTLHHGDCLRAVVVYDKELGEKAKGTGVDDVVQPQQVEQQPTAKVPPGPPRVEVEQVTATVPPEKSVQRAKAHVAFKQQPGTAKIEDLKKELEECKISGDYAKCAEIGMQIQSLSQDVWHSESTAEEEVAEELVVKADTQAKEEWTPTYKDSTEDEELDEEEDGNQAYGVGVDNVQSQQVQQQPTATVPPPPPQLERQPQQQPTATVPPPPPQLERQPEETEEPEERPEAHHPTQLEKPVEETQNHVVSQQSESPDLADLKRQLEEAKAAGEYSKCGEIAMQIQSLESA